MIENRGIVSKIVDALIVIFLVLAALVCIIPFVHVIACTFAASSEMAKGGLLLFPKKFSLSALEYIFSTATFPRSMWNSTWITVVATTLSMLATTLMAYPLSQKNLKGRSAIMVCLVFTMVFNPGMIPGYLNMKRLGLLESWAALIVPQMISTYNLILVKNYFESMPMELRESARIDGAGEVTILWRIMLPLAKPVLAAVGLFYAVDNWNAYMNSILFISDNKKWPMQVILRNMVLMSQVDMGSSSGSIMISSVNVQSLKYAVIMVGTLPILFVYPFLQKYFMKGLMLGSVKG